MAMSEVFMGNSKQCTDEFRAEAVKQVIERGFTVVDVAIRRHGSAGVVSPVEFEKRYAQSGD